MMKATRNVKKVLDEKKVKESFEKDMKEANELKQEQDQRKEFGSWLEKKTNNGKYNEFFADMYAKVIQGTILTDNMVSALRKCMEKEKEWEKERQEKQAKASKGDFPTLTLKIKPFLMKDLNLDSRIITGKVKAESSKAWLIEGHADMLEHGSWCVRCGRKLTEPASQITGMGQICAENAGVPYDPTDVLNASKKERAKIRKTFQKKLHNQTFERWIPKSQAEVLEGGM